MSGDDLAGHAHDAAARPVICVAGVVLRGDELLMVRLGRPPAAGEWSLPGGELDAGETMAEAVVRLLSDQTGHQDVLCGPSLSWSELIDDDSVRPHRVVMYFTAVVMDAEPPTPGSAAETTWTPTWRVPELPLTDGLVEFLADQDIIDTVV